MRIGPFITTLLVPAMLNLSFATQASANDCNYAVTPIQTVFEPDAAAAMSGLLDVIDDELATLPQDAVVSTTGLVLPPSYDADLGLTQDQIDALQDTLNLGHELYGGVLIDPGIGYMNIAEIRAELATLQEQLDGYMAGQIIDSWVVVVVLVAVAVVVGGPALLFVAAAASQDTDGDGTNNLCDADPDDPNVQCYPQPPMFPPGHYFNHSYMGYSYTY